jgi:membrane protease YdiL (CAAX protease family)
VALLHPAALTGLALALAALLSFGFFGERIVAAVQRLSPAVRIGIGAIFALPYLIESIATGLHPIAVLLYLGISIAVSAALDVAARLDPAQRGHWLDFLVLIPLGLAVDLRWLEPLWPRGTSVIGKLVLLDIGLYGFLCIRQLTGVGYDLRLRATDWKTGLREFCFYAPLAIALGLALGFLHLHSRVAHPWMVPPAWLFTFFGVALPEEIFFRGWMQNLLERRIGRNAALAVTAVIFGLSHFNKRTAFFNWRYVILAALAGVFYGRAWRERRRIGASAITHATVDTVWGALLR